MPRTVLFLDHVASLGGAEVSLLRLMGGLLSDGWTPILACPRGELSEIAVQSGAEWMEGDPVLLTPEEGVAGAISMSFGMVHVGLVADFLDRG